MIVIRLDFLYVADTPCGRPPIWTDTVGNGRFTRSGVCISVYMPDSLAAQDRVNEIPITPLELLEASDESLFHTTTRTALESICTDGILGKKEHEYRTQTEQFIQETIAEAGVSLPVDRRNAVFCWPTQYDMFGPGRNEVLLEIEFGSLDLPVYAANLSRSTEVVCGYEESEIPPEENAELRQHVRAYADSIMRVESWDDVRAAVDEYQFAEVLVPGQVPPEAVRAVGVPDERDDPFQ